MLRHGVPSWIGLALVAMLTVALVATGFAHRMPSAAQEAFVMAGGELADLCGDEDGSGAGALGDCFACHVTAAVILPDAALSIRDADLTFVAEVIAPRESRALRHLDDPTRASRGPPLA